MVVACCCCIPYRLALMLAATFAPCVLTFAPYILTFGSCACGVSLLSTGANIPLAQVVVATSCNLRSWCFFIQPLAQIVYLHTWWHHPLQLALVVLFHPSTGANTALAPGQLALCGGLIIGAKVGANISASRYGMQQQHATTTTTTTDHADMTNTARCSNHCNLREG